MSILCLKNVSKRYSKDATALNDISFSIDEGEFAALAGPSGSGKTTILNLAGGLDTASEGEVLFLGKDLAKLNLESLAGLRRRKVGFVFQAYNLFPVLNAVENVEYPLALNNVPAKQTRKLALAALAEVGLADFARRRPSELSGGQQQRVAIARAIVINPKIVFADEPTANLDSGTAEKLLLLFRSLNESKKITFLFSSHDPMVLGVAKRTIKIHDGRVASDSGATVTTAPPETELAPSLEVPPEAIVRPRNFIDPLANPNLVSSRLPPEPLQQLVFKGRTA